VNLSSDMNRRKQNRRRSQGRRPTGGRANNLALSLFDSMGRRFATRGDRITFKDKSVGSLSASSSVQILNLNVGGIGPRAIAVLNQYTRWRYVKIVFRIDVASASVAFGQEPPTCVGILDDYSGEGGSVVIPSTVDGVFALRCATMASQITPAMLQYDPVDKDKWYYTQQGATGTDLRLTNQATLIAAPIATGTTLSIAFYFIIEAEGAVSISGT